MPHSPIANETIAELGFRKRFGVNVIAIRRKNRYISANLADVSRANDIGIIAAISTTLSQLILR